MKFGCIYTHHFFVNDIKQACSETQKTSTRKKRRTKSKKALFKEYFQIGDLVQVEGNDIY